MEVQVNPLAVLLAAASTMIIGTIWYNPKTFAPTWEKLARIEKKNKASPAVAIPLSVVAALVTAYFLAHFAYLANVFYRHSFLQDSLIVALWAWLGFTAMRVFTHDVFENRPRLLTFLTAGYELVTFLVMGLIIGLLKP